ncbi:2,3-diaminopropionate biosynthesis protein SbnB [Chitiniphilus purpureus]|uniref:2,3-diaminopropionate biosynthesis protein SbnB n=1 Tax=Chitiniphilus purpureus TaxID=2981137 RepID=A0ABY6DNB3_9NEIS|nr:2,3-diaminopropionate biosynthesis protein SbnB [Chitiniphilus sp. CD1]UXY15817.1 2,3-diaminopropionate biosynthesis protein SbnB [Chitiniphilus sp. CD1]
MNTTTSTQPNFFFTTGSAINEIILNNKKNIIEVVRKTYIEHHRNRTLNPDSYFLRFPDRPNARIIALPAALTGEAPISGIKWISSYPENVICNLQRASAVLILNDYDTGYPFACLEASLISAARTAASAVLAADVLSPRLNRRCKKVTFIGAGVISKNILDFFHSSSWVFEELDVVDLNQVDAIRFANFASEMYGSSLIATASTSIDSAVKGADIIVLATTTSEPYLLKSDLFNSGQVVLNISLRDLSPEIILTANNVFDDVEHCMKANTSPHLAEQKFGNRNFVTGTLAEAIVGDIQLDENKPIIFSPFGLGILDLALGTYLFNLADQAGKNIAVPGFFCNVSRW